MSKIIRYTVKFGIIYIGINWIADNPQFVDYVRNCVNQCVSYGVSFVGNVLGAL